MDGTIGIIGAGIVGVTSALELRDRGFEVILIDRKDPGRETSYGNAGVISGSTVLTVNNPDIWRQMPRLLSNRSPYFRYRRPFLLSNWRWALAFAGFSRRRYTLPTARALCRLQAASIRKHQRLIERAGAEHLLVRNGWLKVFRSRRGLASSGREQTLLRRLGIPFAVLSDRELPALEPCLRPVYCAGLLLHDCWSVRDPYSLTRTYMGLYRGMGGTFVKGEVRGVHQSRDESWSVRLGASDSLQVDQLLVAAGPWAPDICAFLGYTVPMAWERGYHTHLEPPKEGLGRPVFDVELGTVMSPQVASVRVSTGVELTHRDAPPDRALIRAAVRAARSAADFGRELDATPWVGSRPTLPDSLPMIGKATRHERLWFNFGHQHIGLSTSTGSAELIAAQIEGKVHALIDAKPFAPGRLPL